MKISILKSSLTILLVWVSVFAFSQKKETRDVPDFSGVALGIPADLYLSQGSPHEVIIKASEDDLAKIETEVKNGLLKIKTESWRTRFRDVEIWVTTPDVNALHMSGSGKIMSETSIRSEELDLRVSGSGKIKVDELAGDEIEASISGSGNVYLAGTAEEMEISISGSGSCHAADLSVKECDARISGSGSCKIDATEELNAAISGSGRITYFGKPVVDASVSGSGRVKQAER
jgi:hypothetical protein